MPKQPNKAPVTLARMKMDSSRVHAYHSLEFGKTGYLSEWLPSWLAPYVWWDSNEEKMYYRASDGDKVLIPNGYYIVQMPSKFPLVISPSGFEADWFPLSPDDDGYDVLATDNAITRSESREERLDRQQKEALDRMREETTHSLENGDTHSIVQRQNHDRSLGGNTGLGYDTIDSDEWGKIVNEIMLSQEEREMKDRASGQYDERDSYIAAQTDSLAHQPSRSEPKLRSGMDEIVTHSLLTNTDPTMRDEAAKRITRSLDHNLVMPVDERVNPWHLTHSIEDLVAYMKVCQRIPFSNWLKGPDDYTPEGLRNLTHLLNQSFPEPSPELSDKGAATPEDEPYDSIAVSRAYKRGVLDGKAEARKAGFDDGHVAGYAKAFHELNPDTQTPSESLMKRDDYWFERGKSYGKQEIMESLLETLRRHGWNYSQPTESVSAGSSGEASPAPAVDESGSTGESGHGQDTAEGTVSGIRPARLI